MIRISSCQSLSGEAAPFLGASHIRAFLLEDEVCPRPRTGPQGTPKAAQLEGVLCLFLLPLLVFKRYLYENPLKIILYTWRETMGLKPSELL